MHAATLFDDLSDGSAYGLSPETRILRADFMWHTAGSLRVGDSVLAFDESVQSTGKHRKFRVAVITSRRCTVQRCYRVRFCDGRQVVASPHHQWLFGRSRGMPLLDCEVCGQVFKRWQGLAAHRRYAHSLPGTWKQQGSGTWIATTHLRPDTMIKDLGRPWAEDHSRTAGYLAAAFDGEGSLSSRAPRAGSHISFAQLPGSMLDTVECMLKEKGYYTRKATTIKQSGVCQLPISGVYDCFRFLGECRPVRLLERAPAWVDGRSPFNRHGVAPRARLAVLEGDHVGRIIRSAEEVSASSFPVGADYVDQEVVSRICPSHQCSGQFLAGCRHPGRASLRYAMVKPQINGERPVETLVPLRHVNEKITLIEPSVATPNCHRSHLGLI